MRKISKNLISFLMLIAITMPIMGCKSPTIPEHRITFNVGSAKEWNEAVNTIETGDAGESYVINVRNDFELPGTENPTFGNATDISVEIKGKYTLTQSSAGSLIYIGSGQNVTVSNIVMKGGVYVSGASAVFTMKGKATLEGIGERGVLVTDHGILNMQDNTSIKKKNMAVRVNSRGTFNMTGGTISENQLNYRTGSAGVWLRDGSFNMYGGSISKNHSIGRGGTVFLQGDSVFTMFDGIISETTGNAVYLDPNSSFTMFNGIISENTGNAVYLRPNSSFTMFNGTIHANFREGVYVEQEGTFQMMNGTISGNKSNGFGGGVLIHSGGNFKMFGGIIYGGSEHGVPEDLANAAVINGSALYLHLSPNYSTVAQYGDGTDILPHVEGELDYTNHTIIGRTSHDNIDMENTIKKIKTHFTEEQ